MIPNFHPWIGYPEGAIKADSYGLQVIKRNGSTYVVTDVGVWDVHPRVTAAGMDDERVEWANGVYPVRWKLDASEIANLISLGD